MAERLDIIIFGATGFTGQQAVEKIISLGQEKGLNWGIAGRSHDKLKNLLQTISDKTGTDVTKVQIFTADVNNESSLIEMTRRALALVNCCGPYRFYGEQVVKACIETGTHHIDVSGEPQFMEQMQLKYHKAAEEKGIYVISACGFDSIVSEFGIIHMMNEFKGQLNSVETYLQTECTLAGPKGAGIHYGTWESAVFSLLHANELRELRQQLFPKRLPNFSPRLKPRSTLHKSSVINKWCLPFPGSDRSVALRTQRYFYDNEKKRPLQVQSYIAFKNLFTTLSAAFMGLIFGFMAKTSFTKDLLLSYPKIFSFGMVSHEGPSDEARAHTTFALTLYGEGWPETNSLPDEEYSSPPSKKIITKVSGQDPGYGFTCTALILCAVTALQESSKMPGGGGVFPPGAAFAKTSLLKELQSHGLKVEVLSKED